MAAARLSPPPPRPVRPAVVHRFTDDAPVRLHYVEAGAGEPIVLLHGFPDFWYGWRFQIPALAGA